MERCTELRARSRNLPGTEAGCNLIPTPSHVSTISCSWLLLHPLFAQANLPGAPGHSHGESGHPLPNPSVLRNPLIAETFHRTGAVEVWGRGTNRVIEEYRRYGVDAPSFEEQGGTVVVTFKGPVALSPEVTPQVTPHATPQVTP
jgi:hypothetical protein